MKRLILDILSFLVKAALVMALCYGLYHAGSYAYDIGHQLYDGKGASDPPGRDVTLVVAENMSVGEVADFLYRQHVIRNKYVFRLQERISVYRGQLMAGSYVVNSSQSVDDILAVITGHEADLQKETEG